MFIKVRTWNENLQSFSSDPTLVNVDHILTMAPYAAWGDDGTDRTTITLTSSLYGTVKDERDLIVAGSIEQWNDTISRFW
jgi:hypothetical protein